MFKKVLSAVAALSFAFGFATQLSNIAANVSSVCSYVCCDHDGDGWSN